MRSVIYYNIACPNCQAFSRKVSQNFFACAAAPSNSRTPAVGNSRSLFVALPSLARTRLVPCAGPRTASVFPGRQKARGCTEQVAHTCGEQFALPVFFFPRLARTRLLSGCRPALSFCFPGQGESPRLHRASRAHLRWAIRAPCLWLCPASHARGWFHVQARARLLFSRADRKPAAAPSKSRTPAVSNSRSLSFSSPRLARTRLLSGCRPALSFCFPGQGESPRLRRASRAHLRWAIRAPCLWLCPASHARGWFHVQARARLLFSRADRKPAAAPSKSRTPAVSNSRSLSFSSPTSRTHAAAFGVQARTKLLFSRAGRKPAAAPSKSRTPAVGNSRSLSFSSPRLARTRLLSGCRPALSFCSPRQTEILAPVPCSREETQPSESPGASPTHRNARKAELCSLAFRAFPLSAGGLRPEGPCKPASSEKKGEIRPQGAGVPLRTETLEKLSFAPGLFKRFPVSRRFAARRAVKPASSAEEGKNSRREQEWGSKGQSPSRFFSPIFFPKRKWGARRGMSDK